MGANYYQTDDRDDYFEQFRKPKRYVRFSIQHPETKKWSDWCDKGYLKRLIIRQTNYTKYDLKILARHKMVELLEELGYAVHSEILPYITGYPKYNGNTNL